MACKVVRWKSPVFLFLSATNSFVENCNKWTAKSEENYAFSQTVVLKVIFHLIYEEGKP
jgi:uncharacterized protein (DUF1015 family)